MSNRTRVMQIVGTVAALFIGSFGITILLCVFYQANFTDYAKACHARGGIVRNLVCIKQLDQLDLTK